MRGSVTRLTVDFVNFSIVRKYLQYPRCYGEGRQPAKFLLSLRHFAL